MLLACSNLARLVTISLVILVVANTILDPVDAAFEGACVEKCLKTRRCKKFGAITFDFDCDKQCKKKCYKVPCPSSSPYNFYTPFVFFLRLKPNLDWACSDQHYRPFQFLSIDSYTDLFMPNLKPPINDTFLVLTMA